MVEGVDVPAIEARIAQYQKENSEQIMNAQARKVSSTLCVSSFLCDIVLIMLQPFDLLPTFSRLEYCFCVK